MSWPEWLVTYRGGLLVRRWVTHPSTHRAQRRVTSLMHPTTLPLRQTATNSIKILLFMRRKNVSNFCRVAGGCDMHQKCVTITRDAGDLAGLEVYSSELVMC